MILQVELNSSRAKKKPFTHGDVSFYKSLAAIFSEKMCAVAISAADNMKKDGAGELTRTIGRITSIESHKVLCRQLQEEMKEQEDCENCVVLFNDKTTK